MVTLGCNLRCTYCYETQQDSKKVMDLDYAKNCVETVLKHSRKKNIYIGFFGGEPLLAFSLIKKVVKFSLDKSKDYEKELTFGVVTNTTIVTPVMIEFFKKHNILLEISIDGDKASHDLHRKYSSGKGSFETVTSSLALMKKMNYNPYSALILVTPDTVSRFARNMIFLDKYDFTTIKKDHDPSADWNDFELEQYSMEYNKLCTYALDKIKKNEGIKYAFISNGLKYLLGKTEPHVKNNFCGAGYSYITVAPDKTVYPCARFFFLDSLKISDNIDEFCDDHDKSIFYNCGVNDKVDIKKCSFCSDKDFCRNYSGVYCLAKNYMSNKNMFEPFDLKCKIVRIEANCIKKLHSKIVKEKVNVHNLS